MVTFRVLCLKDDLSLLKLSGPSDVSALLYRFISIYISIYRVLIKCVFQEFSVPCHRPRAESFEDLLLWHVGEEG